MSNEIDQVLDWRGRTVVDQSGQKVGILDEIYLNEGTNEPTWAAVKTGPLRLRRRVVPVANAHSDGASVFVPFTKEQVRSAPAIDSEGWVPERDQTAILRHYGVGSEQSRQGTERRREGTPTGAAPEATEEAQAAEEAQPTREEASEAPPGGRESQGIQLKRYTVTETVTRRSEFDED
jgi:hypothetical protein